jgi:hypothetical protein
VSKVNLIFSGSNTHANLYEVGCAFGEYLSNIGRCETKNSNCQPDSEIQLITENCQCFQ